MITYVCASCRQEFNAEDSDKEKALKESEELWGKIPEEQLERVCDICYKQIMKWYNEQPVQ